MSVNFNGTNIPIIGNQDYWKNRTVARLKQSYDALREAREFLIHAKIHNEEVENMLQVAGTAIVELAKKLKDEK